MLIIAVGLGVVAAALLTWPWRSDAEQVEPVEVGYAWRGRRGAVLAALGVLIAGKLAMAGRDREASRLDRPLPDAVDPLVRAVYDSLGIPRGVKALLARKAVRAELPAVARRAVRAGLRVGVLRRAVGSLAAVAAPVVAAVAGNVVVAVVTGVVALALLAQRGRTLAGRAAMGAVRRARPTARATVAETSMRGSAAAAVAFFAVGAFTTMSFMGGGWGGSDGGGGDHGGDFGGGDFGGGDGGGGGI